MTTQIIEVIVSPEGQTKVETKGFAGPSCRDASRFIEDALGARASEQLTANFTKGNPTSNPRSKGPDMTTLRRHVLRPHRPTADAHRQAQLQKRRARLEAERATLNRWMSRLKRAFHAVERQQGKIARLERQIARLDQS